MPEDLYSILGVSRSATADEIKRAYRKLAHQHHPDKKGGNEEKFKQVNAAYQVLGDAQKRAQYDQFGEAAFNGGGAGGFTGNPFGGFDAAGMQFDFGDIFDQFFGGAGGRGRRRERVGEDVAIDITIPFTDSAVGLKRDIKFRSWVTCEHCHGNKAEPGTPINTCGTCHGRGSIEQTRQTMFGVFAQQQVCPTCAGEGKVPSKPCTVCRGEGRQKKERHLSVDIPAGIQDGQTIRLSGKGEPPAGGGKTGDLYINVHVEPHRYLTRKNLDVHTEQEISFIDAILGSQISVPTLQGEETITIPAGTQPNTQLRLKHKGFPALSGSAKGDEVVTIKVLIPKKVTRHEREVLEGLKGSKKKRSLFG